VRRFQVAGLLIGVAMAATGPARADPAIWRVVGPRASVFIVGSTPAVPGDGKWRTPALQQAAASAQEVWFTTPFGLPGPLTALRMLATIQTKGRLPDHQSLSSMLSPDGRARLARLAKRDGIALEKLNEMTPWNAQITLALAARRQDGTIRGLPVERYVIANAPSSAPKRGLDNLEDDLKRLISTPEKEQVYDLEEAMKRYEDPSLSQRYGEAWAAGDQAWIQRERDDKLKDNAPETYQIMQVEPRRQWAQQVAAMARGTKTAILVLDAANLVGAQSLINDLRREGLDVVGP
jgi:uncharacterized protein YbaP (TraB family)